VRALGAAPYGASRTGDKLGRARDLGMADGIVAGDSLDAIPEAVRRWTDGRGVDVVLDLAGGPYVAAGIQSLAPKGRLMCIGTVAGGRAELELRDVLSRRLTVRGTVFRSRPLEEKIAAARTFAQEVVPMFARGLVRAVVDSEFPLERVREAHQRLESNATFGKVVLRIGG
jgi:NADPH:quinone reductase-like Zn-dependent oxidoreductase